MAMIRKFAAAGILVVPFVFADLADLRAQSTVPKFNVDPTCRAESTLSDAATDYKICVEDENQARDELQRGWSKYPAKYREQCVSETRVSGSPSYVEVLTCIQMFVEAAVEENPKNKEKGL
jgi:hypothetical protein